MSSASFLTEQDLRDFARSGRLKARRILPRGSATAPVSPSDSNDLVERVRSDLRALPRRAGLPPFFAFSAITVQHDDGATWSAELVAQMLEREYGMEHVHRLGPTTSSIDHPAIVRLIGERPLIRCAIRVGAQPATRYWSAILPTFALAVLCTVAAKAMPSQIKLTELLTLSGPVATALLAAAAGVLTTILLKKLDIRSRAERMHSLMELIAPDRELPHREKLVDALVCELAGQPFPRYVVLDDFERLDSLTRDVIVAYLEEGAKDRKGAEAWVSIESPDGHGASRGLIHTWELRSASHQRSYEYFRSYEQQFLTKEERHNLAELLGRPDRKHFPQIKLVCSEHDADVREQEIVLRRYHERHPDRAPFNELDLLHFLSLAGREHGLALSRSFLTRIIVHGAPASTTKWDIKLLLYDFFRSKVLSLDQLQRKLEAIPGQLGGTITVETGRFDTTYHVIPAAAAALENIHEVLHLRPSGLGHLYWALYIDRDCMTAPFQASLVRELAYHLLRAEPYQIGNRSLHGRAVNELVKSLLRCAEATLRVCLFTHTIPLLERATVLLQSERFPDHKELVKQVLSTLWEAYATLGDDKLLTLALSVQETHLASVEEPRERSPLLDLFTATVPVSPQQRLLLGAVLRREFTHGKRNARAALDYGTARAAWLAVTLGSSGLHMSGTRLQAALAASSNVSTVFNGTSRRILETVDKHVSLLDVATLSVSFWGEVLRLRPELSLGAVSPDPLPGAQTTDPVSTSGAFSEVVKAATDTVLIAKELYRSGRDARGGKRHGFVLDALCEELCATALAGILQGWMFARQRGMGESMPVAIESIRDVFQEASQVLKIDVYPIADFASLESGTLPAEVDNLLRVSGMVWEQFGATNWATLLQIRRAQYRAFCLQEEPVDEEKMIPVSTHEILRQSGSLGVHGHLALADAVASFAGEISAHHTREAARIAIAANLDAQLCRELCLLVVQRSHAYSGWDPSPFLAPLLEPLAGRPYVEQYLLNSDEASIRLKLLGLLNASYAARDEKSASAVRECIRRVVSELTNPIARREADDVLRLIEIKELHAIDSEQRADALWAEWSQHRGSWVYPVFLRVMLESRYRSEDTLSEAVTILRSGSAGEYTTAPYRLAVKVAQEVVGGRAGSVSIPWLIQYLRSSFKRWKTRMTTEENLDVLRLLQLLDPSQRLQDDVEMTRWQLIKIRRDHVARFPHLAVNGQMFIILFDTVDMLMLYGLPLDATPTEFYRRLNPDPASRAAALAGLLNHSGSNLKPLISGDRLWISTEFLTLGHYLFTPPTVEQPEFEEARRLFNTLSKDALAKTFELAVDTPSIPQPIRELVKEFSARFDEIQLPSESVIVAA